MSAYIPEPPVTVSTANNNEKITVSWSEPVTNGSPITSYSIYVQATNEGSFTLETVDCQGASTEVINARSCDINLSTLYAPPFNLVQDENVVVKVASENIYGLSEQSSAGSGATIWVVPDKPINFQNVPSVTDGIQIGLQWQDAPNFGSTPVLDYRIFYALEVEEYTLLEDGILDKSHTTTVTLQAGSNYKFKV